MYKLILLLMVVGLISCKSKDGDPTLWGDWESEICNSPDLGEFTYKYRFLDQRLYELHVIPVGENGAFVTWGEYELLGKDIIETQSKYIGGILDGEIAERDEFNPNEEGDSGRELLSYKLKSKYEMVLSWSDGERVVFKKKD